MISESNNVYDMVAGFFAIILTIGVVLRKFKTHLFSRGEKAMSVECVAVKKEIEEKLKNELDHYTPTREQDLICAKSLLEIREMIRSGIEQSKKDVTKAVLAGGIATRNDLEQFKTDIIDAIK